MDCKFVDTGNQASWNAGMAVGPQLKVFVLDVETCSLDTESVTPKQQPRKRLKQRDTVNLIGIPSKSLHESFNMSISLKTVNLMPVF